MRELFSEFTSVHVLRMHACDHFQFDTTALLQRIRRHEKIHHCKYRKHLVLDILGETLTGDTHLSEKGRVYPHLVSKANVGPLNSECHAFNGQGLEAVLRAL